jgi:crossover junction endodeoxyribonuclease RuvC
MIILAMDLSLNCPGFAVLKVEGKKVSLVTKCIVDNEKDPETPKDKRKVVGRKLQNTARTIQYLIKEHNPDYIVRERGFSFHNAVTQALFRVVGIADLIVYDATQKEISEIAPKEVKKMITGNGSASKEDVARCVEKYVGYQLYHTQDESDAVAVGLSFAIKIGEIERIDVIDITPKQIKKRKPKPKVGRPKKKKKQENDDDGKDVVIINGKTSKSRGSGKVSKNAGGFKTRISRTHKTRRKMGRSKR